MSKNKYFIFSRKLIFPYLFCLITFVVLFIFVDINSLKLLYETSFSSIFVSCLIALSIYTLSGIEYYFIRKNFGISLNLLDVLLLPIVGNLWSFIIPFQGNMIFTTIFFKKRYKMAISESFSISIYLYLVTISFTGLFGILFSIYNDILISWFGILSFIMLINPVFIYLMFLVSNKIGFTKIKFIDKIKFYLNLVISNVNDLWLNAKITSLMFILNTVKIVLSIFWFYWISISLGFNLSILTIGLLSLIMSISVIIKFTPDNLGVAQIISAIFMGVIGEKPEHATLITLFASGTTIILISTIGIIGNFYYFKSMNFFELLNSKNNNENF